MYPYPMAITDELSTLIGALANPATLVNPNTVHAAWGVIGFGLKTFVGKTGGGLGDCSPATPWNEKARDRFLLGLKEYTAMRGEEKSSLADWWATYFPLLLALLQKLLLSSPATVTASGGYENKEPEKN